MKFLLLLSIFILLAIVNATAPNESKPIGKLDEEWTNFKEKFSKKYDNTEEDDYRKGIFATNLKRIKDHNKKYDAGEVSFKQGINHLADLTPTEYRSQYLGARVKHE